MMLIKVAAGAALASLALLAWSERAAAQHDAHHQKGPAAPAAKPADTPAAAAYRSAFADYRPFRVEEPPKDWRRANDEVREAGGHVGLLKGQTAQQTGHGAHGAKQPAPPVTERK